MVNQPKNTGARDADAPALVIRGWDRLEALSTGLAGLATLALLVPLLASRGWLESLAIAGLLAVIVATSRFEVAALPDRVRLRKRVLGVTWRSREMPLETSCEVCESWEAMEPECVALRPQLERDPATAYDYAFGPSGRAALELRARVEAAISWRRARFRGPCPASVRGGVQRRRVRLVRRLRALPAIGAWLGPRARVRGRETILTGVSGRATRELLPCAIALALATPCAFAAAAVTFVVGAPGWGATLLVVALRLTLGPRYRVRVGPEGVTAVHRVLGIPLSCQRLGPRPRVELDRTWEWPDGTRVTLREPGRVLDGVSCGAPWSASALRGALARALARAAA